MGPVNLSDSGCTVRFVRSRNCLIPDTSLHRDISAALP